MKVTPEQFKQYIPYIIIGGVAGVVAFLSKKTTTSTADNTSTTDTSSGTGQAEIQNAEALVNQLSTNTNNALKEQSDYYDGIIGTMKESLTKDETSIASMTTHMDSDASTIKNLQSSTEDLKNTNTTLLNTITSLTNKINSLQNPVATNTSSTNYVYSPTNEHDDKYYSSNASNTSIPSYVKTDIMDRNANGTIGSDGINSIAKNEGVHDVVKNNNGTVSYSQDNVRYTVGAGGFSDVTSTNYKA